MGLTQGHNAVMPVKLKPATPRSRVKHSTTEPLRSLGLHMHQSGNTEVYIGIDWVRLRFIYVYFLISEIKTYVMGT